VGSGSEQNLFHFDWVVDQHGYELVKRESHEPHGTTAMHELMAQGGWIIRSKGGPPHGYRPLEDRQGMFRQFASLKKDPDAIMEFVNEFGLLGVGADEEHMETWQAAIEYMEPIVRLIDDGTLKEATYLFNARTHPQMSMRINNPALKRARLQVTPTNLLGAMWLQLGGEITHGTKFKTCKTCPTWFPVGPGTNNRVTREYCSNRCRTAWNRPKNKGE
jgi:hypothetical protein